MYVSFNTVFFHFACFWPFCVWNQTNRFICSVLFLRFTHVDSWAVTPIHFHCCTVFCSLSVTQLIYPSSVDGHFCSFHLSSTHPQLYQNYAYHGHWCSQIKRTLLNPHHTLPSGLTRRFSCCLPGRSSSGSFVASSPFILHLLNLGVPQGLVLGALLLPPPLLATLASWVSHPNGCKYRLFPRSMLDSFLAAPSALPPSSPDHSHLRLHDLRVLPADLCCTLLHPCQSPHSSQSDIFEISKTDYITPWLRILQCLTLSLE